jgi:hypothetical protein
MTVTEVEQQLVHPQDWQRLSMSEGTKGPRLFDWVCVPILSHWQDDGQHWLLIRRCLTAPFECTHYRVYGPKGMTLQDMVCVAGTRWHIEEIFESAKGEIGLDHYEVRTWTGWYRHITLAMLAHAFLAVMCARAIPATQEPRDVGNGSVLPPTIPEIRHLLWQLIWPHLQNVRKILGWSWWRRLHRTRAQYYHTKRRLHTG